MDQYIKCLLDAFKGSNNAFREINGVHLIVNGQHRSAIFSAQEPVDKQTYGFIFHETMNVTLQPSGKVFGFELLYTRNYNEFTDTYHWNAIPFGTSKEVYTQMKGIAAILLIK